MIDNKRLIKQLMLATALLSMNWEIISVTLSSNSKNDPFPPFTTLDPHTFLTTREKLRLKGYKVESDKPEYFGFSISPFGQNADIGKNIRKEETELGDLGGRWGMIALLFGKLPQGATSLPTTLQTAQQAIFPDDPPPINNPKDIDREQRFGFFSIPLKYRKRGIRFEVSAQIIGDFGIKLQAGVADICQTVSTFTDLTTESDGGSVSICDPDFVTNQKNNIQQLLMCKLKPIAEEIGLDIANFHEVAAEDVRINLYWRHIFDINKNRPDWPQFLITPFISFGGIIAAGKEKDPNKAFALSFGNNDHNAIGVTAGLDVDFVDTIEIGAEAGITHFFDKDFCKFRVPNSECQSGIFPFTTDVTISPGHNWHFAAKMLAYHFLEDLSLYFQYVIVQHRDDKIKLKKPDPAFKPEVLERISTFKVQVANVGLNYDISPNISLGFLWQAPISQRNVYRSSTVMFSFNATF